MNSQKNEKQFYSDLDGCLEIFYKWARRGFISGQIKEKYDTTRWYANFGIWGLHGIFYPRHSYYRWPAWTWNLNELSQKIMNYTGFMWLVIKWQKFSYASAYKECFKLYPEFKNHCIDYPEFIGDINQVKEFEG